MLYSVGISSGVINVVSVKAEESESIYRTWERIGAGFDYHSIIRKDHFLARGIAPTEQGAIDLFIAKRNKAIEDCYAKIEKEREYIAAANALLCKKKDGEQ